MLLYNVAEKVEWYSSKMVKELKALSSQEVA